MDFDTIVDNISVFSVRPFQLMDREGADVVTVVAKVTWSVSHQGEVHFALRQRPVRAHAKGLTEEAWSSVVFPADAVESKPGTDVMMRCTAQPPTGKSVKQMDVGLHIAGAHQSVLKTVRVFGPRVFQKGVKGLMPGPAGPLAPTPVVYEFARGGIDRRGDEWLVDPANPAGVGVSRQLDLLVGTRAPQLETVGGKGLAGFGPIAESWEPRPSFAGTTDDAWRRKRAPLPPKDFDPRANCWANPDLWCESPLEGTEAVEVKGATPSGVWRFRLPNYAPRFESVIDGVMERHDTHLDTFFIDADDQLVELTWRASVRLPRKVQRLEKLTVRETNKLPEDIRDRTEALMAQQDAQETN